MDDRELKATGAMLRVLAEAIERKGGSVSGSELSAAYERPAQWIARLMHRALAENALEPRDDAMLSALSEDIESEWPERLALEQQGAVMLGYRQHETCTVTAKEAADRLGVSVQRVSQLIADGSLKGYKVRGKWRVGARSVERRIEEQAR